MVEQSPKEIETRRALLRKVGRYAAVSAPAVILLLAASTKPATAATSITG